jgi:RNA polymerase sigma-70 factor (ECF subfamily)
MPTTLWTSLFSLPDEQAMWRVQTQDDAEAFALLVRRWETPVRRLCARMLGDVHRGEDLAQEAFARAFARRRDFEPGGRFSTWLWRVALNLCHDELRRRARRGERPLDDFAGPEDVPGPDEPDAAPTPAEALVAGERAEIVRLALLRLPAGLRSVVVLRHYEGLKFAEIAAVLDLPEGTVKSRMAEALDRLGRWLQPLAPAIAPPRNALAVP